MATPVVTVASGGLPVIDVTATFPAMGKPVTEAANGRGTAVTKVAAGGMPVTYSSVLDYPPPPFNPLTNLPGVIGWWDTKIFSSLTLSGSNVMAFADRGGLGNHLGNGGLNRTGLVYSATGFNTLFPGITASGGNAFLETTSAFAMGTGNTLTCWYVGTMATGGSAAGTGRMMSYTHGGQLDWDNPGSWALSNNNAITTGVQISRNNLGALQSGASVSPAGHRVIATINSSGVMTVYIDGVAGPTTTAPGNWISTGTFDLFRMASHDTDFCYVTMAEAGVATGFSNPALVTQFDTFLKQANGL